MLRDETLLRIRRCPRRHLTPSPALWPQDEAVAAWRRPSRLRPDTRFPTGPPCHCTTVEQRPTQPCRRCQEPRAATSTPPTRHRRRIFRGCPVLLPHSRPPPRDRKVRNHFRPCAP